MSKFSLHIENETTRSRDRETPRPRSLATSKSKLKFNFEQLLKQKIFHHEKSFYPHRIDCGFCDATDSFGTAFAKNKVLSKTNVGVWETNFPYICAPK